MILLFQLIVLTTIWCLGVRIATNEGMVFEKLRTYGNKKVNEGYKIFEPLFICIWCMPSIHSLIGFGFAFGMGIIQRFTWNILFYYPLVVMGSSILGGLIWQYHEKSNAEKDASISVADAADMFVQSMINPLEGEEEYEESLYQRENN